LLVLPCAHAIGGIIFLSLVYLTILKSGKNGQGRVSAHIVELTYVGYCGKCPKLLKIQRARISLEKAQEEKNIPTKSIEFLNLVIKHHTPKNLNSLKPFFENRPPIPQILVFDQPLMTHNISGPYHAVILHQIDFEKEKLLVIDPAKKKLKEPYAHDFRRFKKAWRALQNMQIITYPKDMVKLISGPTAGIVEQRKITNYAEEKM